MNIMSKKFNQINTQGGEIKRLDVPFTQIANSVLNDKKISFKAKGVFAYIYSKPHGWQFSSYRMAKDSDDGIDAIRSAVRELMSAGYLSRKKLPTGKVEYTVTFKKVKKEIIDEDDNCGF